MARAQLALSSRSESVKSGLAAMVEAMNSKCFFVIFCLFGFLTANSLSEIARSTRFFLGNLLHVHAVGVAFDFRHISIAHFTIRAVRRSDHAEPAGVGLFVVGLPLLQDFPSPASVSPHFVRVSCRASFGAFVFHVQSIAGNARHTREFANYFQKDFCESR